MERVPEFGVPKIGVFFIFVKLISFRPSFDSLLSENQIIAKYLKQYQLFNPSIKPILPSNDWCIVQASVDQCDLTAPSMPP